MESSTYRSRQNHQNWNNRHNLVHRGVSNGRESSTLGSCDRDDFTGFERLKSDQPSLVSGNHAACADIQPLTVADYQVSKKEA